MHYPYQIPISPRPVRSWYHHPYRLFLFYAALVSHKPWPGFFYLVMGRPNSIVVRVR